MKGKYYRDIKVTDAGEDFDSTDQYRYEAYTDAFPGCGSTFIMSFSDYSAEEAASNCRNALLLMGFTSFEGSAYLLNEPQELQLSTDLDLDD